MEETKLDIETLESEIGEYNLIYKNKILELRKIKSLVKSKNKVITLRLTIDEEIELTKRAMEEKKDFSTYIRGKIFN